MSAWQQKSSREVYANPWIRVVEDQVVRPDGSDGMYGVLELRHPAVFVVPVLDDERIVMVHVDRYTTGTSWEVPAGGTDGDAPEVAAARELGEETGYAAASYVELGTQWSLNGVARLRLHHFLARGLSGTGTAIDEAEGISEVAAFTWAEVKAMLRDGRINDNETAGALMLAAIELGWT
jgi:8-oxo-dGTP pyrophosphatase MutT (NUDIX family)